MSTPTRPSPPRKPQGGRPNIRKQQSEPSSRETHQAIKGTSLGSEVPRLPPIQSVKGFLKREDRPWISQHVVESPSSSSTDANPFADDSSNTAAALSLSKLSFSGDPIVRQTKSSIDLKQPVTIHPPLSPTKARWDKLRQHVLPASKSTTVLQTIPSPPPSFTSFSHLNQPRPSTPKQSRLARFAFRQVVTDAREAADHLTRKFSEDVMRACWAIRHGDIKMDREPQTTLGSALHLPFKSSASLVPLASSSTTNLPSTIQPRQGLKRPQSTLTLTQTLRSDVLVNLQNVIVQYASYVQQKETAFEFLPHEKDVLSVLLVSFLNRSTGRIADEERRLSLEIFETIIRTWPGRSSEDEIDRCLWCCKALTMPPSPLRSRVFLDLIFLLSAREQLLTTPVALKTIIPSLTFLIPVFAEPDASDDLRMTQELIQRIYSGEFGRLFLEDLEQKYNCVALKTDSEDDLRHGICVESASRCLEYSHPDQQWHILTVIEQLWAISSVNAPATPLRTAIHLNKINTFLRAATRICHEHIKIEVSLNARSEFNSIIRILQSRVLMELENFPHDSGESIFLAAKLAISISGLQVPEHRQGSDLIMKWLRPGGRRDHVSRAIKDFVMISDWVIVLRVCSGLVEALPLDECRTVVALIIPHLQERIINDPPKASENVTQALEELSHVHPQVFYKPLFACATGHSIVSVANHLNKLITIARYMPSLWTSDAEMISVAIVGEPGGGFAKGKGREGGLPSWGVARLGQSMLILELIDTIKSVREQNKESSNTDLRHARILKFVQTLETRLSIALEAKEQASLLPLSQRVLFASLFLEIRLLTRSLKSSKWVHRLIVWTIQLWVNPEHTSPMPFVSADVMEEVEQAYNSFGEVLVACRDGLRPIGQRRNTGFLSPTSENQDLNVQNSEIGKRLRLVEALPRQPMAIMLEVLVAINGQLTKEDLDQLCPVLWKHCLDYDSSKTVSFASFLTMQCAEKSPTELMSIVQNEMESPSAPIRTRALMRLSIVAGWRYQFLSMVFITDRTHRRPFKMARPPISFVATDVGSNNPVRLEEDDDVSMRHGQMLPLDLRRRLSEIGWGDDDKPVDQKAEWVKTPMFLLSSSQVEQLTAHLDEEDERPSNLNLNAGPSVSPGRSSPSSPSPNDKLLRRNSSANGKQGIKRRPVFVQSFVPIFLTLATLATDRNFTTATLARSLLLDFMRDDPATLSRPILDILSADTSKFDHAVNALRSFLHTYHRLPPRLSYHIFNHLAGFLKTLAKDEKNANTLQSFALIAPLLTRFATQVSDLDVRALRRAKIEVFLFPSSQLWFSDSTPAVPMFPRGSRRSGNPFETVQRDILYITMIRTAQNMFFVEILKHSPQDVHVIRKAWSNVILPGIDGVGNVTIADFVPQRNPQKSKHRLNDDLMRLSLSFCRSHLLLIAQIFRSLTRHLNDREELGVLFDGINRILLRHGDDIGIVAHALIAYMVASTRFRRLMSSSGGFSLFMPVLLKIYCEAGSNEGIRNAIDFAFHRFFAVHEEILVFQTLDVMSNLVRQPRCDSEWVAWNAFQLLSSLKGRLTAPDFAGIRDANKTQEEETALAITADERPQLFLASLKRDGRLNSEKINSSLSIDVLNSRRFSSDNLVRLLITVIAHDQSSQRAEYFLRLFRLFTVHLYNASSTARSLLRDGIDALGSILSSKVSSKNKPSDQSQTSSAEGNIGRSLDGSQHPGDVDAKPKAPADTHSMRSDYLLMFASFMKAGGQHRMSSTRRALDLARLILKESSSSPFAVDSVKTFIDRISETMLLREDAKQVLFILQELAPIIRTYGSILDITGLLTVLTDMCSNGAHANDEKFSEAVVTQICSSALDVCELAASESMLSTIPFRQSLIILLARSVGLAGVDIVVEIEKRRPTPEFLASVVLPFAFLLKRRKDVYLDTQWNDSWRQDWFSRAWVRLLFYAMDICQGKHRKGPASTLDRSTFPANNRSVSQERDVIVDDESCSSRDRAVCVALAVIILKVVTLRGEDDISSQLPSAWTRVSSLLRNLLHNGDATFAIPKPKSSPFSSPLQSPVFTPQSDPFSDFQKDNPRHKRFSSSLSELYPSESLSPFPHNQSGRISPSPSQRVSSPEPSIDATDYPAPRIVDYLTWSTLEFLCLRRSSLVLHMRTFILEKALSLSDEIKLLESSGTKRGSVGRSSKSLRPISTVFSKPRWRSSLNNIASTAPTPEGSPRLVPVDSVPTRGSLPRLSTLSTWAVPSPDHTLQSPTNLRPRSSPSSPVVGSFRKKIVHLGLDQNSADHTLVTGGHSLSHGLDSGRVSDMATDPEGSLRAVVIRSRALAARTCERVRLVQACLGYRCLLNIPPALNRRASVASGSAEGVPTQISQDSEPDARAWTRRQAEEMLVMEARDFLKAWATGATSVGPRLSLNVESEGPKREHEGSLTMDRENELVRSPTPSSDFPGHRT